MPIASYSKAPLNAWAGWRLRIAGGPAGGQYHGYIAADDLVDDAGGWPQGHDEIFRPIDSRQNLGIYPWHTWGHKWHGSPLLEGQTVSDFLYRSPAELRPRPNASGGINVVRAVQLERTPGYAVAPGNYRTLGAMAPIKANPIFVSADFGNVPAPVSSSGGAVTANNPQVCPAWGCGSPPWLRSFPVSVVSPSPSPAPTVTQPPPPTSPAPAPTTPIGPVGTNGCAAGQYRDAAGNCTSDWRNPYPMYLPLDNSLAPAPTVAASTCPTGYTQDPTTGNCLSPGVCPTGYSTDPTTGNCVLASSLATTPATSSGITGWLGSSSSLLGMNVPNWALAVGLGFAAMKLMGGRHR